MQQNHEVALESGTRAALARARLVALDVDGTLTDGRVVYVGDEESLAFDVRDGQGLAWLVRAGLTVVWITGRGSRATERRARELGVTRYLPHCRDKGSALEALQRELGFTPTETVAMGDDLPDLALGRRAALLVAPADAVAQVRARAGWVTAAAGGRGAVRELCEHLLRARGEWDAVLGAAAR